MTISQTLLVCEIDILRVFYNLRSMSQQDIYREVGQAIRRCREDARRTQAQLAAEIGISRASLANIEAGRQNVLIHYLYAIADVLELDSPFVLMPVRQTGRDNGADASAVQLPETGLTEKQRQEVLRLMGGAQKINNPDAVREEK